MATTMSDTITTVGFIGTGLMGVHMARNLLKAGYQVRAWNRTISKAEPLRADGAYIASSAHDAVSGADMVVTMLADGQTVADVMFAQDVSGMMKSDAVLVDMSSIKPKEARQHAQQMKDMSLAHLDAPVSGGTKGAEAGTLAIMAGGDEAVFERCKQALGAMGRPVRVGPDGAGQLSKLANQTIVAVTIGVVAEAILLAEKGGADPDAIRDALKGGFADSVILQQHGERMTQRNFVPGGLSKFQLKDILNVMEEASDCGIKLPLAEQVTNRYQRLIDELDGAELDHAALYLELLDQQNA
jgi:3-hydroxyisobutyrate dehydrogenase-like beta-hydroxyacid dehydrogenase